MTINFAGIGRVLSGFVCALLVFLSAGCRETCENGQCEKEDCPNGQCDKRRQGDFVSTGYGGGKLVGPGLIPSNQFDLGLPKFALKPKFKE